MSCISCKNIGKYIIIPIVLKDERNVAIARVLNVRLRRRTGLRTGSSARDSTKRNIIQLNMEKPRSPIIWTESQGYLVPAKENPIIVAEDARATSMHP
jgi:hypothetical protein